MTEHNVTLHKQIIADDGMTDLRMDVVLPIPPHVGMWIKTPGDCGHVIREVTVATDTQRITCCVVAAGDPKSDHRGLLADVIKKKSLGWALAGWADRY